MSRSEIVEAALWIQIRYSSRYAWSMPIWLNSKLGLTVHFSKFVHVLTRNPSVEAAIHQWVQLLPWLENDSPKHTAGIISNKIVKIWGIQLDICTSSGSPSSKAISSPYRWKYASSNVNLADRWTSWRTAKITSTLYLDLTAEEASCFMFSKDRNEEYDLEIQTL